MQTMQQQLAMMHQLMMQQMALTQQPMCQPINVEKSQTKKRKWNQMKYCWTHGACNHWSPECRAKAEGHQDSANFQDRKGESTKNLQ